MFIDMSLAIAGTFCSENNHDSLKQITLNENMSISNFTSQACFSRDLTFKSNTEKTLLSITSFSAFLYDSKCS